MIQGRHTVLVLEDEPFNQATITRLVKERSDLELVHLSSDGYDAINFIRSALPDIALIDIDVPRISGLRVAETAVKSGCTIVFTTGLSSHALRAYQLGAADYLVKPIDKVHFDKAVDRAIALHSSDAAGAGFARPGQDSINDILIKNYALTPAELEITCLILSGCPKELLEERSGKTPRTIKSHLQAIYRKTVNEDPRSTNEGRSDKFGRLVYFLFALKERCGTT